MDKQPQQQEEGFAVVSSFMIILLEKFGLIEKRPVVRVTGSHKHSCIFGAISIEGKQLFR